MGAITGAVQDIFSGGKQSAASDAAEKASQQYANITPPDIESQKIQLQQLVQQGKITPEQAQTVLAESSQMQNISTDPRLQQAQMAALSELQNVGQNGMSDVDRANYEKMKDQIASQEQGQRQSILQNAAQRGVGGSGLELMAQLQNQQGSAQRASQQGFDQAAQAQQARLQALQQAGQLGGQIQSNSFNQQSAVAQAQDAINKFNAQNQNANNQFNVSNNNSAQAANLQNAQNISNQNAGIANQQQMYNKGLIQQNYNNQMGKAGATANALDALSNNLNQQSQQNLKFTGDAINSGAKAFSASDERVKENIQELKNPSDILNALTGYKYNYKKPELHGEGPQVGVMAQDVEKVLPQAVKEVDGVKMIDSAKLSGPILAILKEQNDKIKELENKK